MLDIYRGQMILAIPVPMTDGPRCNQCDLDFDTGEPECTFTFYCDHNDCTLNDQIIVWRILNAL